MIRRPIQFGLCLLLCTSLLLSGCATLIHGTTQTVSVSSNPDCADVYDMGNNLGKTPIALELSRKKKFHNLGLRKEGFRDEKVRITRVVSGAVAGNILLGGFIGWGIDAASGAQWKLIPEEVYVELKPAEPGETTTVEPELDEWTVEEELENLKRLFDKGLITEDEYKATKKVILENMTKE